MRYLKLAFILAMLVGWGFSFLYCDESGFRSPNFHSVKFSSSFDSLHFDQFKHENISSSFQNREELFFQKRFSTDAINSSAKEKFKNDLFLNKNVDFTSRSVREMNDRLKNQIEVFASDFKRASKEFTAHAKHDQFSNMRMEFSDKNLKHLNFNVE